MIKVRLHLRPSDAPPRPASAQGGSMAGRDSRGASSRKGLEEGPQGSRNRALGRFASLQGNRAWGCILAGALAARNHDIDTMWAHGPP